MISDNFVVGDNVYLNELKNFFFEVLGMMSITHYGCIGDGRTDNYASLQVAIDDANRRGLCYLYVPYGLYRFRGELINERNVIFIGNPRAKIFNDRTKEEIEIKQFGVPGCNDHKCKMTFLEANLTIVNGTLPSLTTGSYFTDGYVVMINGEVVLPRGTPFYYDAGTNTISWLTGYAKYQDGEWVIESGPDPEPPEEDDEMKAIITAELSDTITGPETTQTDITLDTSIRGGVSPELLALTEGYVLVSSGVSKVKVSGMLYFTPSFLTIEPDSIETRKALIIVKRNDEAVSTVEGFIRFYRSGHIGDISIAIAPKILEVQGGDKIYLAYDKFEAPDYINGGSYLTVEVVNSTTPTPEPNNTASPTIGGETDFNIGGNTPNPDWDI